MTIAQLLEMPVGEKTGGFELSIKTFKKGWQAGKIWMCQVILMDATGEMPADVRMMGDYAPNAQPTLRGHGNTIKIIVCEVQNAEYLGKDRKKLYVDQYSVPTMSISEWEQELDEAEVKWDKINRGKVRHGLVCSLIRAGFSLYEMPKKEIEALVEYIMTGE